MYNLPYKVLEQRRQRESEDFIREVLTKVCPLHGKHANVHIDENWRINITACCNELNQLLKTI